MQLLLTEIAPLLFVVTTPSGAKVYIGANEELRSQYVYQLDEVSDHKENEQSLYTSASALRPTELLPAALASCSTIDVRLILQKQRQKLDTVKVHIYAKRDTNQKPSPITSIQLDYFLTGDIDANKAYRATSLALEKYCTVYLHLSSTIAIHWQLYVNEVLCTSA